MGRFPSRDRRGPLNVDVVIPAYRARQQVCGVVRAALAQPGIRNVIVIDDACPERCGDAVAAEFRGESRVIVLRHERNLGVGGAVLSGYARCFADKADAAVKLDADGQMRPQDIPRLLAPLAAGAADYTKGNRFHRPRDLAAMPPVRRIGNAALSLLSKFCSGYWTVIDPTNGYTALHAAAWAELEPRKLDARYFFELDMLYRLGVARAVVEDVPMPVIYGSESSGLSVGGSLASFPGKLVARMFRRIAYQYFIRDFNAGSLMLLAGVPMLVSGLALGIYEWVSHFGTGRATPTGTIIIVALLILMGYQSVLSALTYDITHEPRVPLQRQRVD